LTTRLKLHYTALSEIRLKHRVLRQSKKNSVPQTNLFVLDNPLCLKPMTHNWFYWLIKSYHKTAGWLHNR